MVAPENRTSTGALSHWPRCLALVVTAVLMAAMLAEWVAFSGWGQIIGQYSQAAVVMVFVGGLLAVLARPGEANPWRTAGVWTTLLAYGGTVIGQLWNAWWNMAGNGEAVQAGSWFMLLLMAAWVLAGVYTLVAYALTALLSPPVPPVAVPAVQLGAAALVPVLTALGVLLSFWSPPQHLTVRAVAVLVGYALATAAVVRGTMLQARDGPRTVRGGVLVWSGVVTLVVAGVLDSFALTSLSGVTGFYPVSTTPYSGFGPFVLPAGVVALVGAIGGRPRRRRSWGQ